MTRALKQRRRQNFTRKQKGGGLFDFLSNNINIGQKVQGLFSRINPFTIKKTSTGNVTDMVNNDVKIAANAPKKLVASVSDEVRNIAVPPEKSVRKNPVGASKLEVPRGGTRKRKQRKQRKQRKH
mgnify:CR=1 FL=1